MKTSAVLAKLEGVWEKKRPSLRSLLRPPATNASIAAVENSVKQALPAAFKSFYEWHDGFRDEHAPLEGFFGWWSITSMMKHKESLDQMEQQGFFEDSQKGSWWNLKWLPFLQSNYSDLVCVDLDGSLADLSGAVFIRENSNERRTILAPSFDTWLHTHVEITEVGPDTDDEDEWIEYFSSRKALKIRSKISPGFPKYSSAIPADEAK